MAGIFRGSTLQSPVAYLNLEHADSRHVVRRPVRFVNGFVGFPATALDCDVRSREKQYRRLIGPTAVRQHGFRTLARKQETVPDENVFFLLRRW